MTYDPTTPSRRDSRNTALAPMAVGTEGHEREGRVASVAAHGGLFHPRRSRLRLFGLGRWGPGSWRCRECAGSARTLGSPAWTVRWVPRCSARGGSRCRPSAPIEKPLLRSRWPGTRRPSRHLPLGFVVTCGSGWAATPCLRMHVAYLNAAAAGPSGALVVGELDEDPQAPISKDAFETTTSGRKRPVLRLVDRCAMTCHIGR